VTRKTRKIRYRKAKKDLTEFEELEKQEDIAKQEELTEKN
jgi:hypothetical protein